MKVLLATANNDERKPLPLVLDTTLLARSPSAFRKGWTQRSWGADKLRPPRTSVSPQLAGYNRCSFTQLATWSSR